MSKSTSIILSTIAVIGFQLASTSVFATEIAERGISRQLLQKIEGVPQAKTDGHAGASAACVAHCSDGHCTNGKAELGNIDNSECKHSTKKVKKEVGIRN